MWARTLGHGWARPRFRGAPRRAAAPPSASSRTHSKWPRPMHRRALSPRTLRRGLPKRSRRARRSSAAASFSEPVRWRSRSPKATKVRMASGSYSGCSAQKAR
eukprot:7199426-Pyramimonas_sp.AAC.1